MTKKHLLRVALWFGFPYAITTGCALFKVPLHYVAFSYGVLLLLVGMWSAGFIIAIAWVYSRLRP